MKTSAAMFTRPPSQMTGGGEASTDPEVVSSGQTYTTSTAAVTIPEGDNTALVLAQAQERDDVNWSPPTLEGNPPDYAYEGATISGSGSAQGVYVWTTSIAAPGARTVSGLSTGAATQWVALTNVAQVPSTGFVQETSGTAATDVPVGYPIVLTPGVDDLVIATCQQGSDDAVVVTPPTGGTEVEAGFAPGGNNPMVTYQLTATGGPTEYRFVFDAHSRGTVGAVSFSKPPPKLGTLRTDFSIDTLPRWLDRTTLPGHVVSGGRLEMPVIVGYNAVESTGALGRSINNSFISSKLTPPAVNGATGEAVIAMFVGAFDSSGGSGTANEGDLLLFTIDVVSGLIRYRHLDAYIEQPGGTGVEYAETYDPVAHAYVRLRVESGTAYWDTSPDGTTWTTRKSKAAPAWVADDEPHRWGWDTNRNDGTPDTAYVEDVNLGVP